ncbi:hypothetical protein [Planomonospora sp. ID82291]|uniref:DUF6891 domain-containing protein n=1 Tax=Planomonospora sp. ID82291 TaxID=2738136 RepID=UPI0018C40488|nr:hypothetical protein [Planomonospora sp. ID82291]
MTAPCARVADMVAITVRTEDGRRHVRVDAGRLAELIGRLGGRNDRFLVVQRIPDLPEVFVQVWHENGGDYVLEHRDGAPDRHCQAEIWSAGAPDARGYVYFHSQCTDSAARGHGLALLYDGFDGSSDTTASIGREFGGGDTP